jgi:hypothetical protein
VQIGQAMLVGRAAATESSSGQQLNFRNLRLSKPDAFGGSDSERFPPASGWPSGPAIEDYQYFQGSSVSAEPWKSVLPEALIVIASLSGPMQA